MFIRIIIIPDAASVEKMPSPTFTDSFGMRGRVSVVTYLCHAHGPFCRVTPRSLRARYDGTAVIAPRGTDVHKMYAEQELIRQSRECDGGSGIWNVHLKASPARPPLSDEQLTGGGTPPPLVR